MKIHWSVFHIVERDDMYKFTNFDGDQHLVTVRAEVSTLCQVDFTKGSFTQLPLQHNVLSFDMLHTWSSKKGYKNNMKQLDQLSIFTIVPL